MIGMLQEKSLFLKHFFNLAAVKILWNFLQNFLKMR